jgi:hypothetical protein
MMFNLQDMFFKVHYLFTPLPSLCMAHWLASLTSMYDTIARLVFLKTLQPKVYLTASAYGNNGITHLWYNTALGLFAFNIGFSHVLGYALRSSGSQRTISIHIFPFTSFVHYMIYIHLTIIKRQLKFQAFNTQCFINSFWFKWPWFIFKLSTLDVTGFNRFRFEWATCLARYRVNQTYFGVELGVCKYNRWVAFLILIQHPMIIGIAVFVGCNEDERSDANNMWLVPFHISLYLIHMLQEHWDIHIVEGGVKSAVDKED